MPELILPGHCHSRNQRVVLKNSRQTMLVCLMNAANHNFPAVKQDSGLKRLIQMRGEGAHYQSNQGAFAVLVVPLQGINAALWDLKTTISLREIILPPCRQNPSGLPRSRPGVLPVPRLRPFRSKAEFLFSQPSRNCRSESQTCTLSN